MSNETNLQEKLTVLQAKFLCCFSVNSIDWQDFSDLSWDSQFDLLNHTILHPLNNSRPIKRSYQLAFLKGLIQTLERNASEVHDRIYEEFCNLQTDQDDETTNFTFKHYEIQSRGAVVTLKESKTFISNGTTGLCSWQASLALSEWLLRNPQSVADKVILELGAGTGLSGIVAAKCCNAKAVTLTDGSQAVVDLLRENIQLNFVGDETAIVKPLLLRWEEIDNLPFDADNIPNVLLGADITFDSSVFPALILALDGIFAIAKNECIFYLAATIRNEKTFQEFLNELGSKHFTFVEQQDDSSSKDLFWDETTPIRIIAISR